MNQSNYDIERAILACIMLKPKLIDELYVNDILFQNPINRRILQIFKVQYRETKNLDTVLMVNKIQSEAEKQSFINELIPLVQSIASPQEFYQYQEELQEIYKNSQIEQVVNTFVDKKINKEELIDELNNIQSQNFIITKRNKKTPDEILALIRKKDNILIFSRLQKLNQKLRFRINTVNIIAARPSEGKSAFAINLFTDLSKKYKCLYFNLEMTEAEMYERIIGIESAIQITDIIKPQTSYQDVKIKESINQINSLNYEIINGSQNIKSIKSKIIKEQREEHLIVFIDYVGYVQNKWGQSDKDRIGEVVREFNNITKDYNCTIFLVAQINRQGSDKPSMEDLKDSGELEQTADTIMILHDSDKANNDTKKYIDLLIPKARGSKRNVAIKLFYDKSNQRIEIV